MKFLWSFKNSFVAVILFIHTSFNTYIEATTWDTTSPGRPEYRLSLDFSDTVTLGDYDRLIGSIKLHNGITCTGDSSTISITEPIDGRIFLNGYTLLFKDDVQLGQRVVIHGSGFIGATNPDITKFHLSHAISVASGTVIFLGVPEFDGHAQELNVIPPGRIQIGINDTLLFDNISLLNVNTTTYNFQLRPLTFRDTRIYVSDNFKITYADMYIGGDVKFYGTQRKNIEFQSTHIGINTSSQLTFDPNCNINMTTVAYPATYPSHYLTTIRFGGPSAVLYFDNCNVNFNDDITQTGPGYELPIPWMNGTVMFNGIVNFNTINPWYRIKIGDGIQADDPSLVFLPSSRLVVGENIDLQMKITS